MNGIPAEQNTDRQLQRLGAQRQLYATAKTVFGWQAYLGGPVAVMLAFVVIAVPQLKGYVALWGIVTAQVVFDASGRNGWPSRARRSCSRTGRACLRTVEI